MALEYLKTQTGRSAFAENKKANRLFTELRNTLAIELEILS